VVVVMAHAVARRAHAAVRSELERVARENHAERVVRRGARPSPRPSRSPPTVSERPPQLQPTRALVDHGERLKVGVRRERAARADLWCHNTCTRE
jgi:hypothetical protein